MIIKILSTSLLILSGLNNFMVNSNFNVTNTQSENNFHSQCDLLGISVGNDWIPYHNSNGQFLHYEKKLRNNNGMIEITTVCDEIILRHRYNSYNYAYLYRVHVSPTQWTLNEWSFKQLKTTVSFYTNNSLVDFSPKNENQSYNGSLDFSIGTGGAQLGATIPFNTNDVSFTSNSSISINKYITTYTTSDSNSTYSFNDSTYYGFCTFRTYAHPEIEAKHVVNYNNTNGNNHSRGDAVISHYYSV